MELLLISRCPPFPVYYGDRLIPHYLSRELAAKLHRIDLLAFYQRPSDLADVPRYGRYFSNVTLIREPQRALASYRHRSRNPETHFPKRADDSWSPEMWETIQDRLRARAYDAVHLFGGVQVYEYYHLVRALPNVIVPYESYSLWLERDLEHAAGFVSRWVKRAQYRMARDYESWMFEPYDRVVVLTDRDARALKNLNPRTPTVVIPNGVDVEYFSSTGHDPNEPTLLFTGNYDYAPNLDAALRLARDIFPQIKKVVPKSLLYLIGGNAPPELMAYASDSILIPGRVPDLRPYYDQSLIFVSPLRMGAGIKNKVLESMAMETPVVATPLSCDGIPVLQGQHVLLGDTDEDLVKNVFRLFKDRNLRQHLARNGRLLVEQHFTWKRVADMYNELFDQVINERRARGDVPVSTDDY